MTRFRKGKFDVEIKGKEIDELEAKISSTGNRVALSFVLSALLISSTMALGIGLRWKIFGISGISFFGYVFSLVLIVWLGFSFLRSKFE